MTQSSSSRRRRRLWKFAGAEFDEASWTLRVDGHAVTLEGKPLEVLHELLLRAGEVDEGRNLRCCVAGRHRGRGVADHGHIEIAQGARRNARADCRDGAAGRIQARRDGCDRKR